MQISGLFDLVTENSDSFENEAKQKFESEIEHQNKWYVVEIPRKLHGDQLNDNRKLAEGRFLRLKKNFVEIPSCIPNIEMYYKVI